MTKPCRAAFIIDVYKKHRFWCFSFVTLFNLQGTRPSASAAERTLSYHVVRLLSSTFSTFSKFFRRLPRLSAALSDSPSSISELPEFVKHFFHFVEIFFALSLARPPRFRQFAYYTRPFPFCQHFFPSFCRSFIFLIPAHQPAASPLLFPIYSSMPLGTKRMVFRTFYGSHCLSFLYTFIITSCILSLIF